jgi:murein DD-endopeptidase MepM/ murein hydrolase activator NlpD
LGFSSDYWCDWGGCGLPKRVYPTQAWERIRSIAQALRLERETTPKPPGPTPGPDSDPDPGPGPDPGGDTPGSDGGAQATKPCSSWGAFFPQGNIFPVTSGFPYRNNGVDPHNGIDIASPEGTTLVSPAAGTVGRAGLHPLNGNTVDVVIGRLMFTAIHLLNVTVTPGQQVAAGDVLGRTGGRPGLDSSGTSRGVHVHVTVRLDGVPINPISGGCYGR